MEQSSAQTKTHLYGAEKSTNLDNKLRKWLQNPYTLLAPFVHPKMTVIDLGCGPGFFTLPMADMVGNQGTVIAIDTQEEMLKKLNQKMALDHCSVVSTINNHGKAISFHSPIDFILAAYVLHEIPNLKEWLQSLYASLRTGGQMLVMEPNFVVSKKAFKRTIAQLESVGFLIIDRPSILLSKSVLAIKR